MIRAIDLTKEYGQRKAVDHLNFDAKKGEILGFLGPNGAGKTTTMRILAGFIPPTDGKAEVGGFDVVEHSLDVRRLVGYLPETVPLYPDMTIFAYLKFMADLRKVPHAEDRVDEVLEMVHLEERSEGYIGNLSKGMRQRVGLAQALIHRPEVLILDEPTIGLDPAQIIDVRDLIREIGKERTVLLSTHILSEAQQVCNRVMIINHGKIVAEDTPERLQSRLAGGQKVILKIRGEADDAVPVVKGISGILDVVTRPDGSVEFDMEPGADKRADVARAVIKAGFDLLEMRAASLTLEEIFLQLTREDPGVPELEDQTPLEVEEES
jgi:ABC-2 type transport system ATP-binding protein